MRLLILFVFISFSVKAQYGFFGKKNAIEITFSGNLPLMNKLINDQSFQYQGYLKRNDKLVNGSKWFHYGFGLQNIHYFSNHFGLGINYQLDLQGLTLDSFYDLNEVYDYVRIKHENPVLLTHRIMPFIELNNKIGILPSGFSHQIGGGITLSQIQKKQYLVENPDSNPTYFSKDSLDWFGRKSIDTDRKYVGISLTYGMQYRIPLNKRLFIGFRINYSLNLAALGQRMSDYDESKYYVPNWLPKTSVALTRASNVIQLTIQLGLSY